MNILIIIMLNFIILLVFLLFISAEKRSFLRFINKNAEFVTISNSTIKNIVNYNDVLILKDVSAYPLITQCLERSKRLINEDESSYSKIRLKTLNNLEIEELFCEITTAPKELIECFKKYDILIKTLFRLKSPVKFYVYIVKLKLEYFILGFILTILKAYYKLLMRNNVRQTKISNFKEHSDHFISVQNNGSGLKLA